MSVATREEAVAVSVLTKSYEGPPSVEAIRSASFVVKQQEYVAVVGPSGSGKSTLLNVVGCLDRPSSGTYRLFGRDVSALTEVERAAVRGREIGFIFQTFHLIPSRTVAENVSLGMLYTGLPSKQRTARAMEALHRVGLGHRADFHPTKLSGGELQRVAIARAVAAGPRLLLADEPTGNLDSETGESILTLFDEMRATGMTVIVVTHDQAVSSHSDRELSMIDGTIAEEPR